MRRLASLLFACVLLFGAAPAVLAQDATPLASPPAGLSPNATVVATGLDSPRGLAFAPDGTLTVAEAGTGGTVSTEGQCDQVVPPVGPYLGGTTGRISKIDASGTRGSLADGLPSNQTGPQIGSEVSSVADVAYVDGQLLYLLGGGGCSHGVPNAPNGVYRLGTDGTSTLVADLGAFYKANPAAKTNPGDFEPDGTPYSMALLNGTLYVVEPNHGEVDAVDPATGTIRRVVDISATYGHIVPASIAVGPDGNLYVGNLTSLPYLDGTAVILKVTPDGQVSTFAQGLTTVLGLAWVGNDLYALESTTNNLSQPPFVTPGSGRVVRVTSGGTLEPVATGLTLPTALRLGPDGALYVSNVGYGMGPTGGKGEIVRIALGSAATPTS